MIFFVSLSEPVILSQDVYQGLVNQKPFFASAGYSFEPSDKLMLNPSFLYELNSQGGNALNLNAKTLVFKKSCLWCVF